MKEQGRPFEILLIAVSVLIVASFIPFNKLSGGAMKDFNLFGDLFPSDNVVEVTNADTYIDPDLLALQEQENEPAVVSDGKDAASTQSDDVPVGDIAVADKNATEPDVESSPVSSYEPSPDGLIEDFTPSQNGLSRLKESLSAGRNARIAILGDSYIEGDIFSQDVRELLQEAYGGSGAGYVPVSTNQAGFRQSVRQACSGWKEHDFRKSNKKYASLQGFYYTPDTKGRVEIKGSKKMAHAKSWERSTFMFVAPSGATVTVQVDGNEPENRQVEPSDQVQAIVIDAPAEKISLSSDTPDLIALGLYLDGNSGIALDNMSIRGYAGIRHNIISESLAEQMRRHVDYDLIIIEYGINAMSSGHTNYNAYIKAMEKAVGQIKKCYPLADIMIMGIGDRGEKVGTEVHSMSAVEPMIAAQRDMARRLGLLFWDTRAAMGGADAVVSWASTRDVNKDYIHLSHRGGARLAELFTNALKTKINE